LPALLLAVGLITAGLLALPARAARAAAPAALADRAGVPGPDAAEVDAALAASPAVRAARLGVAAARSELVQDLTEPSPWTATPTLTQRRSAGQHSNETELLLERRLRRPQRRAAAEQLGRAREQAALLAWQLAWREQARELLAHQSAWLRDCQAASAWDGQQILLENQAQAVLRRQALGDAAVIEARQARAAATQAATQAALGTARCQGAAALLQERFAGLSLGDGGAPLSEPAGTAPARVEQVTGVEPQTWVDHQAGLLAWLAASPELALARHELASLAARQALELAEQRADPSVGLRVGTGSAGGRVLGLQLVLSFGGEDHRQAAQRAHAARLAVAEAELEQLQRRLQAQAGQALREAAATRAAWQGAQQAAIELAEAAQALARGYDLGEGSLGEVLAARRLALEQQLAARLAGVEAWQAAQRVKLETGAAWAPPAWPVSDQAACRSSLNIATSSTSSRAC
jgi:hypothetical protein